MVLYQTQLEVDVALLSTKFLFILGRGCYFNLSEYLVFLQILESRIKYCWIIVVSWVTEKRTTQSVKIPG